jgi:hypothetical protein
LLKPVFLSGLVFRALLRRQTGSNKLSPHKRYPITPQLKGALDADYAYERVRSVIVMSFGHRRGSKPTLPHNLQKRARNFTRSGVRPRAIHFGQCGTKVDSRSDQACVARAGQGRKWELHQASKAAMDRSHCRRWRSFLSRTLRRTSSSRGSSRSKVMLAGWKCRGSA